MRGSLSRASWAWNARHLGAPNLRAKSVARSADHIWEIWSSLTLFSPHTISANCSCDLGDLHIRLQHLPVFFDGLFHMLAGDPTDAHARACAPYTQTCTYGHMHA